MNKLTVFKTFILTLLVIIFTSCEAIGTIFKGGMWFGIFIAIIVIGAILYFFGGNKKG